MHASLGCDGRVTITADAYNIPFRKPVKRKKMLYLALGISRVTVRTTPCLLSVCVNVRVVCVGGGGHVGGVQLGLKVLAGFHGLHQTVLPGAVLGGHGPQAGQRLVPPRRLLLHLPRRLRPGAITIGGACSPFRSDQ